MPGSEKILVCPRAALQGLPGIESLETPPRVYKPDALTMASIVHNGEFRPRDQMEVDPSFKQIIPYAVLRYQPEFWYPALYYVYSRGTKGGEQRLAAKLSLGVGGHIEETDRRPCESLYATYHRGLVRELEEEVRCDVPLHRFYPPAGFLNDDSSSVGQVHLGVLQLIEPLRPHAVPRNSSESPCGGFVSAALIREYFYDRLETWSQLVFDFLENK